MGRVAIAPGVGWFLVVLGAEGDSLPAFRVGPATA